MNLDPRDRRGARNRLLVKLLGGLVVAGVVIGLVVGVLGTTMLRSMGLKEQPPPPSSASSPSDDNDGSTEAGDDESEPEDEEPAEEESTDDENEDDKNSQKPRTQLNAQPNPAEPGSEITLSGSFRNLNSGTLQVQRREGGDWTNFPVTASLNPNGTFSTYIITSRTGTSPYRLFHADSGRSTPPVSIRIS